jgi:hypothetical protein
MALADTTILQAIGALWSSRWYRDPNTWSAWFAFLRVLFNLPLSDVDYRIYTECTAREELPEEPVREAWLICGRRAGKSFVLATVAVYLAIFRDWSRYVVPGERPTIKVIAVNREQAHVIYHYIRALLIEVPTLDELVQWKDKDTIELTTGVVIQVATMSYRGIRGFAVCAALCDENAFWRSDESANPDTEVLNALRPAMATVPGSLLLCASSPYSRRGAMYQTYRRYWGKSGKVLVWKAPTLMMNSTVDRRVIEEAYDDDPAYAAAEYGAEFRTDIESFVSREVIEGLVVPDRHELAPVSGTVYSAFVDPSGGSADSMTLAIGHFDGLQLDHSVLDALREVQPPFSPESVVTDFAELLRSYRVVTVTGDRYGGEWPAERFREHGIDYRPAEKSKSDIYREFLPIANSGRCELLDHPRLVAQLCSLERRTARGGRDSIDHMPGGHDDVANAACGVFAERPPPGVFITDAMVAAAGRLRSLRRW